MNLNLPKIKIDQEKIKAFTKKILQDKYDKILSDLRELEEENPDDMRVKQKIAEILFRKDHIDDAIAKYREVAEHFEREDFILKAIKAYQNILKIRPFLVDYNLKLANLYLKIGMTREASNQYRIAINHYANLGDADQTITLSQNLVKIDPSLENRAKLAEIYQSNGMKQDAITQYEALAKEYRLKKDYEKLLHFYELILPHKPENATLLRDVCILHLRQKRPERALKLIEHYKAMERPDFEDLINKAKLMIEALKRQG
ncbi:MAG: tetratricopeptide repeat protein [Deltaproteobacteria bacterium]|nr:tetratricopeptide repeat protein [Deltaproteobacteria bacterium]